MTRWTRAVGIRVVCAWWLLVMPAALAAQAAAARPNVVVIMTDDMGYGDLPSYGGKDIKAPNINGLARAGVRFTQFYANATMCTPTRAGFITGRYQQRYGPAVEQALGGVSSASAERGLVATGRSLPQLLKNSGYATALIGKWHLGYTSAYSPNAHGFEEFFGIKSGYVDYYQHTDGAGRPDLFENATPITAQGYMTDLITERAVAFLEKHTNTPFFMDVAYTGPHWPYQPPDQPSVARNNARHLMPHDSATSTRADYVAMVERVDRGVGQIVATLKRLGLEQNTMVIFTNDNGGEWLSNNTPFYHGKWTLWEGGLRVPTIIKWPGRVPAGRVSSQVGITMDLTASILAATNATVPDSTRLEGINLIPLLASTPVERTLFWRTDAGGRTQAAARKGYWKIVVDGTHTMLFDLRTDVQERRNVAAQQPAKVRELWLALQAWSADVSTEARRR
ncbi:MAG: sulfatase-like hydrolase/transferase [Gemmatimonadaceae bacterium]|nr:sulfatase-like hydrolase/transferase [Gemmatimonadaceae bacterium]